MSQDAISLLKEQHKSAPEALVALTNTTERGIKIRHELLVKLRRELTQHMLIGR